ncbi:RNA polymerase sigma factor, sigma-70 family [Klebsiella pneumoniae]|uniref:sigma factor n=1 Tax=Klebsiella pneumoniae TaxID=573 RepID=UPI0009BBEB0B|nr:sigma factor [Klebsiella pneumoniae]SLR89343.1 RNA polymerase sigma factor, sigma-70 family [Klebsiella pneumoniae]
MSDVTAFNNCMSVFWQQHEAELSRFLASRTGDREQAADLLQEVFLRARACADRFCEMENPRAWLYRRLADELGITLTAFKSRLLRARKHLKKTMTELCQVEVDDASSVCCHKKMD